MKLTDYFLGLSGGLAQSLLHSQHSTLAAITMLTASQYGLWTKDLYFPLGSAGTCHKGIGWIAGFPTQKGTTHAAWGSSFWAFQQHLLMTF